MIGAVATAVGSNALTALAYHWAIIAACRVVQGVASATIMVTAKVIIAEIHPRAHRGKWNALVHFFWQLGGITVTTMTLFLPIERWRLMVACTSVPGALLAVVLVFFFEESPRFLLLKDHERAQASVLEIAEMNGVPAPKGKLLPLKTQGVGFVDQLCSTKVIRYMFAPSRRQLTCVLMVIWTMINFGAYSNFMWFLKYLVAVERAHLKQAAYYAMFTGKMAGVAVSMAIIDGAGRIMLCIPGFFVTAAFTTVVVVVPDPDWLVVGGLFLNFLGEELVWCALSTFTPEVYPSMIRGIANGLLVGFGHIGAVTSGFFGPLWMQVLLELPFYLNTGAYILGGLLCFLLLGADTTGQPLADEDTNEDTDKAQ